MRQRVWFYDKLILVTGLGALALAGVFAVYTLGNASQPARTAGGGSQPAAAGTIAALPGPGATTSPFPAALSSDVVTVELGSTSSTLRFIHLSSITAPAGKVTLIITNTDTMPHELVGFATTTPAAAYPITGFEGQANRIDEDKAGTVVVDTGASLPPGATKLITATLKAGHYALVCNLPGHYAAGMHADFWATPAGATPVQVSLGATSSTQRFIHLSQFGVPAGKVTFIITNTDTMSHELVGFATTTPAAAYPITGFEGQANRIDEDKAGTVVVDTGASLPPGATKLVTATLKAGHYALVCNLPGHYAAGMHADFWAA